MNFPEKFHIQVFFHGPGLDSGLVKTHVFIVVSEKKYYYYKNKAKHIDIKRTDRMKIKTLCKRDPRIWTWAVYFLKFHHLRIQRSLMKRTTDLIC